MKKKLELTKKEIKAVESSIKHWKKDIQAKLLKGVKIAVGNKSLNTVDTTWEDDESEVKCYDDSCALCKLVGFDMHGDCTECPYFKKYGIDCGYDEERKGHWRKFIENPNLKNCNVMIKALEKILE